MGWYFYYLDELEEEQLTMRGLDAQWRFLGENVDYIILGS